LAFAARPTREGRLARCLARGWAATFGGYRWRRVSKRQWRQLLEMMSSGINLTFHRARAFTQDATAPLRARGRLFDGTRPSPEVAAFYPANGVRRRSWWSPERRAARQDRASSLELMPAHLLARCPTGAKTTRCRTECSPGADWDKPTVLVAGQRIRHIVDRFIDCRPRGRPVNPWPPKSTGFLPVPLDGLDEMDSSTRNDLPPTAHPTAPPRQCRPVPYSNNTPPTRDGTTTAPPARVAYLAALPTTQPLPGRAVPLLDSGVPRDSSRWTALSAPPPPRRPAPICSIAPNRTRPLWAPRCFQELATEPNVYPGLPTTPLLHSRAAYVWPRRSNAP